MVLRKRAQKSICDSLTSSGDPTIWGIPLNRESILYEELMNDRRYMLNWHTYDDIRILHFLVSKPLKRVSASIS